MLTVSSDSLTTLVSTALERMAVASVGPSTLTAGEIIRQGAAHCSIELLGSKRYVVTVTATGGFVRKVASGMMGCAPEELEVEEHAAAAVSELANVFGGELAMRMANEDGSLLIGLPRDVTLEDASISIERALDDGLVCIVGADCGELMVAFSAD